jgi:superfamily I DNA/RNA helicase
LLGALRTARLDVGDARIDGIDAPITVVPAALAKGLEFDRVVVVEPAAIVAEVPHGRRALYVALTRPTQHLTVVHAQPLPPELQAN